MCRCQETENLATDPTYNQSQGPRFTEKSSTYISQDQRQKSGYRFVFSKTLQSRKPVYVVNSKMPLGDPSGMCRNVLDIMEAPVSQAIETIQVCQIFAIVCRNISSDVARDIGEIWNNRI